MATVDEKILEIKMKIEGANSVKELKDIIAELTPEMTTADKTAEEYAHTVDLMTKAQEKLTTAMKAGNSQISAQEGSYNALVNKMAALKKVQKAVTDDDTRTRLAMQINTINDQLKAYDQANGVYVRNVGNYKSALEGFDGTVIKFGDSMREAMESIEPTKAKFESIQKLSAGVVSGFAAIQGAASLLGTENEELEKTFIKVQSAMAIAQGFAGIGDLVEGAAKWVVAFGDLAKKAKEASDAVETVNNVTEAAAAASNVAAAANTANAAATAADTTAKGAQIVATEGATVAQKGLNTAMKANPIGKVIMMVTALVGAFVWLKDEIIELLGGTEKLSGVFNDFKVVFTGVGNVIKQIILGPINQLIISIRTIVEVVSSLAQGDFKAAWDAIKDGFSETVNSIKDSLDVVGNYQEAAAKKQTEIQDKARREEAEKREKELNDYIKDMEAKSDKDWKYYEEGKKAYEELYKIRSEMYKKDSDEYKQNQRDIWMYNRDYQDRIIKKEEDVNKKRLEASKKALEEEKQAREKVLQEYNTLVDEYLKSDGDKLIDSWNKRRSALDVYYEQEKKDLKKKKISYAKYIEELTKIDEEYADKKAKLEEQIALEKDNFNFNLQITGFTEIEKSSELLTKAKGITYKWNVEIEGDAVDKIKYINDLYDEQRKIYEGVDGIIAKLAHRANDFAKQYGADSELAIKATRELQDATVTYLNLGIEKFKALSDERVKALEKEIAAEEKAMMKRQFMLEQEYLEYETSNNHLWEFGNNYLSQMYKRWNAEDEIHKARIASMQEMVEAYRAASMDMQLTEEERTKAKEKAAKLEAQIESESADYTLAVNQRKAEAVDNYVNAIQDSLNGISQILGGVADAWETSIQAQIDAGKISEEEGEKQMESMRGIQSAIALINALSSAVSSYNSLASIPYVGPALGAAAAAAALASGIAQVVAINKVKKGDKGGGDSTRYAEVTPTQTDYNPQGITNVTGEQETQNLANAMTKAPIYVTVKDIDDAQNKVKVREKEATF